LDEINTGVLTWQGAILSGKIEIVGNPNKLFDLLGLLNTKLEPMFNIVTP
jgi:alkyl sulfatase BDS1-like metallo-beta-lactamase superfamily hydrolase